MLKIIQLFCQLTIRPIQLATVLLLLSASILTTTALADDTDPTAKWYQIEYVIFEHLQTDDHILRYEDIPYPKKAEKQYSYLISASQAATDNQYTQLAETQMDLAVALQQLKRSRAVRVLDSKAWQQALSDTQPPPIKIFTPTSQERTLFGELQLKKSRFTHAEFKLYLSQKIILPYRDITDWFLDKYTTWKLIDLVTPVEEPSALSDSIGVSELYQNIRYLDESRRIKEGEVHYIDHPIIGVIVTIKEVPSPLDIIKF